MDQKKKNIILAIGLGVVFILAYKFGISKTVQLGSKISDLKRQEQLYLSAPNQLSAIIKKEKNIQQILKNSNVEGSSIQNNLLKVINNPSFENVAYKKGYKVVAFENPHTYFSEELNSAKTTYNFTLQGSYGALIEVIYKLEQEYSFGNIINVQFIKQKNYRTNSHYLQCQVLLQRLESE